MADTLGLEEVRRALVEDRVAEDATTRILGGAANRPATGTFVAEGRFVVAGLPIAARVFHELEARASFQPFAVEGVLAEPGAPIAAVHAPAGVLLAGERVALNFLQRLSGIATLTRRAVEAVAGTQARITHTRKTTPGLRALELYAVSIGGGVENRASLADAVLWKDNHWALLASTRVTLRDALRAAPPSLEVVVEVEDEAQLQEAVAAGARHLLLDNQPPERVAAWTRRAGAGVTIQVSGGITSETARTYALAGAHLIAIGALTHSVMAAPIRFEVTASEGEKGE